MRNSIRKESRAAGLPPGTLVHIGERRLEQATIEVLDYTESELSERGAAGIDECRDLKGRPTVTWINVNGLHEVNVIEDLGELLGLHPLVMEDIVNTGQRPKIEDYDDYLYLVVKMLSYDVAGERVEAEQVSLVLASGCVLSFQERQGDVFDNVRERIRGDKGRIRKMGADYLVYALLDAVVDGYFLVLEQLGDRVEDLQDKVMAEPDESDRNEIHRLKRELISLRRSIWPLRDAVNVLIRDGSELVNEATRVFMRDVYDHSVQIIDTVETLRDMVSGLLDIYLASVSNRMNEVMKVLTIMASLFIPLTFIAGVYGMNFRHMPELEWKWAYPLVWLVMIVTALVMLEFFRRKKWL